VVQEALMTASRKIDEFMRDRPLPFYPWLRQLAWNKLVDLQRKHVQAQKRSLIQEDPWSSSLLDRSANRLAGRLTTSGSSPSGRMLRREIRDRVRKALDKLAPRDREVLVLRHLEELSISEIAAILGLSEEATKKRQVRALERLQNQLGSNT
jgi:RNA polymerase sigma-70 factor, ECF subfamily